MRTMADFNELKEKSQWQQMNPSEKMLFINEIEKNGTAAEKAALAYNWVDIWSRPEQIPYMYTGIEDWDTWYFIAGRGCGKLIAKTDSCITYNRGWITYGDLEVGDYVFTERGTPTRVLATYPQDATNKLKYYRVKFNDGTHIDACGEHLWHTWTHQERKQYMRRDGAKSGIPRPQDYPDNWATFDDGKCIRTKTRTTQQLLDTLKIGNRGDNNHSIPLCKPCQFPEKKLPIHPYLLGYWLGNGSQRDAILTINNDDIECVERKLHSLNIKTARYNNPKGTYCTTLNTFVSKELKDNKLLKNKHIPDEYLTSSIEQRWELVRGLLDSDGCFEAGSEILFYNTNKSIIDSLKKILGSLGCKYTQRKKIGKIYGVEYKECYSLKITSLDVNPFYIKRKANKWIKWRYKKVNQIFRQRARMIVDITTIDPVDMMCITVDSPSAMYLIGDQCTPTHNTKAGSELVRRAVFEMFPKFPLRIGCVTPKFSDIEAVVALGDSGVMNVLAPWEKEKARFYSTSRMIVFNEGTSYESSIEFCSADNPESLRGRQYHIMWLDEIAAYPDPNEIIMQVAMCLRLKLPNGISAKKFITSTPKPYQFLRDAVKEAETNSRLLITRGTTFDNRANLSETMFREIARYDGTSIGNQELYGEIISGDTAGFIKRSWIKLWPAHEPYPKFDYIFTSYDPAFTEKKENDPTGIVIIGVFKDIDLNYSLMALDGYEEWMSYPDLKQQIIIDYETHYGERPHLKRPNGAVIEIKGSGGALVEELARTKVNIIKFNPGNNDKIARVHAASWFFKDGKFYVPESRKKAGQVVTYMEKYMEQLTNFPLVDHDDMVDATIQVILLLTKGNLLEGAVTDRDEADDEDFDEEPEYRVKKDNPYMR